MIFGFIFSPPDLLPEFSFYNLVIGAWGKWGEWETCSKTCNGGNQTRKRLCDNPVPSHGGDECTVDNSSDIDIQDCNTDPCPGKNYLSDSLVYSLVL